MKTRCPRDVGVTLEVGIPPLAPPVRNEDEWTHLTQGQANWSQQYESCVHEADKYKCEECEEVLHVGSRNARIDPDAMMILARDHVRADFAIFRLKVTIGFSMVECFSFVNRVDSTSQKAWNESSFSYPYETISLPKYQIAGKSALA